MTHNPQNATYWHNRYLNEEAETDALKLRLVEARARVAELAAALGVSQVRVSVLENSMESGYQDGRRHACALLSQLVFNSDGVPMGLDNLLTLCAHVETDFAGE